MFKRLLLGAGAATLALAMSTTTAFAGNPPGTGQPSVSCDDFTVMPNGFSSGGFANAETHYANPGSTGGVQSGNVHVVAQYDVACYQQTTHQH
jgi:hypothetical protein